MQVLQSWLLPTWCGVLGSRLQEQAALERRETQKQPLVASKLICIMCFFNSCYLNDILVLLTIQGEEEEEEDYLVYQSRLRYEKTLHDIFSSRVLFEQV